MSNTAVISDGPAPDAETQIIELVQIEDNHGRHARILLPWVDDVQIWLENGRVYLRYYGENGREQKVQVSTESNIPF